MTIKLDYEVKIIFLILSRRLKFIATPTRAKILEYKAEVSHTNSSFDKLKRLKETLKKREKKLV